MADEVHVHQEPAPAGNGGSGSAGWIVALLLVVVLAIAAWLIFARGGDEGGLPEQINVEVNTPGTGN